MVIAVRANVIVLFEVQCMDEFAALMAFGPKIIGKIFVAFAASQWWFFENAHVVIAKSLEPDRQRDNGGLWLSVRRVRL